ncbi:TIGR03752 family integrating conjugative element protein [Vibrio mediterranei]|uniref:TIGR03752 family integrating conjugative element protein n=1 Tax=Vibrio mediterranei TaxID=689 RepID=UPI004068DF8D
MKTSQIVILGGLSVLLVVVLVTTGKEKPQIQPVVNDFGSQVTDTGAISDSTADTLRTLIADNRARDREFNKLAERLKDMEKKGDVVVTPRNESDAQEVDGLKQQLQKLQERLQELESHAPPQSMLIPDVGLPTGQPVNAQPTGTNSSVTSSLKQNYDSLIPNLVIPGVSFGGENAESKPNGVPLPSMSVGGTGANVVWLEPTDVIAKTDDRGEVTYEYPVTFQKQDVETDSETNSPLDTSSKAPKSKPVYTIPANSTLADATTLTAIIGRVPQAGAVVDPFKFKVVVGEKNLATNGYTIPGLESMVLSGVAKGDFTMECASGNITSATFTFKDRTVRVVEGSNDDPLGFIADEYGVPCVPGLYLSNAAEYIATKGAMATAGAFASALADGEVTSISSGSGVTESITGSSLTYGLGKGVDGSTKELGKWLDDRQESAFDAVFIEVGKSLSVHIDTNIELDYEFEGRKLVHETKDYLI